LIQALGILQENRLVNFDRFPYQDLQTILNAFIEMGWSKRYDTDKETYSHLLVDCKMVEDDIDHIIANIVNDTPGMKLFLLVHSAFNINVHEHDWLERGFAKLLQPSSSDQSWLEAEPNIPEEILKKVTIFDPIPYREINDGVKVTYKMWGKFQQGEQTEPILITDLLWESIDKEATDAVNSIKQHEVIEMAKVLDNDDLPF
jgi:hypothetical protein